MDCWDSTQFAESARSREEGRLAGYRQGWADGYDRALLDKCVGGGCEADDDQTAHHCYKG